MTHTIDGNNDIERNAAEFALEIQDAVNLIAITAEFQRQLKMLRTVGHDGDTLNNHPVTRAFCSKLSALCRLSLDREDAAFTQCKLVAAGLEAEYDVIPL